MTDSDLIAHCVQRIRDLLAETERSPKGDGKLRPAHDIYVLLRSREGRHLLRHYKTFAKAAFNKAGELIRALDEEPQCYSSFLFADSMIVFTEVRAYIARLIKNNPVFYA